MIEFNIDPVPKPRMTRSDVWKKRPIVVKYISFAERLRTIAEENNYKLTESLNLIFVIKMPKSWSKVKKMRMNGKPHQQTPDLDNLIKAFKDVLADNDSFVYEYKYMRKQWGESGKIIVNQT